VGGLDGSGARLKRRAHGEHRRWKHETKCGNPASEIASLKARPTLTSNYETDLECHFLRATRVGPQGEGD
jgi:hypothetical protein